MDEEIELSTLDREKILVEKFRNARNRHEKLKDETDAAKEELLIVEQELMDLLDDQGKKSSARFDGLGHVTCVAPRISASFIEGLQETALEKIEGLGRGDMIKRTIHSGTLSTFVKELLSRNEALPEGVTYYEKRCLSFYPDKSK